MPTFPLGRHHQPDERNEQYPVSLLLDRADTGAVISSSVHRCSLHLDQGDLGSCTGNGPTHWRACTPNSKTGLTEKDALALYEAATHLDDIPGAYPPEDTGSSVLAAMKALVKDGAIAGYAWCKTIDDVISAVLHVGAVVAGTDWTEDMFTPDEDYFIKPTGKVAGGHCYCIRGVNMRTHVSGVGVVDYFTIRNSWKNEDGTWWGHNSDCHILVDDFATLLAQQGEVAVPHHVAALAPGK